MIRGVLVILAAIFALAAGGKLWLVATDPFADIKLGYPLPVIWLAIALELSLVVVNLKAILPPRSFPILPLAWLANVAFLSLLFIVSMARWALGYVSCGCFGAFELPIWVTPLLAACHPGASAAIGGALLRNARADSGALLRNAIPGRGATRPHWPTGDEA